MFPTALPTPASRARILPTLSTITLQTGKYILSGEMDDVSDALNRLLWVHLQAHTGAGVLALPDDFRRREAYTEEACIMLKKYEHKLHCFFDHASTLAGGKSGRALSVGSWLEQMRLLGLIGPDLAEREAVLCFSWSRMAVVDTGTAKGRTRSCKLPFEGYLEALCRVSTLKAMPTDEDVVAAGCADAGEYTQWMRESDYDTWLLLVKERALPWGYSGHLPQPLGQLVKHLLAIMANNARNKGLKELCKSLE